MAVVTQSTLVDALALAMCERNGWDPETEDGELAYDDARFIVSVLAKKGWQVYDGDVFGAAEGS
jgi:hypothetical protein